MATVEERLSRLEGGYEHLATKADLYQLENSDVSTRKPNDPMVGKHGDRDRHLSDFRRWTICAIPFCLSRSSSLHNLNLLPKIPGHRIVRPYLINRMSIQDSRNLITILSR